MKRRAFLQWLAAGAAAIGAAGEIDVERVLWVPGAKTIFLPPKRPIEIAKKIEASWDIGRSVHTTAGRVVLDVFENVVSLNGRTVGAQEAARLRLTMFNPSNPVRGDLYAMTCQIVADRVAAGWPDPVGPGGMPRPPMVKRKIVLEGA